MEPETPLIERIWWYVSSEASMFDKLALQLYAQMSPLIEQNRCAASGAATEESQAIVRQTQLQIDAYAYAVTQLRQAANALREARLGLTPYIDPNLVQRS